MAGARGLALKRAERHPRFRVGARLHFDLSEPDRPHSARRPRAQVGDPRGGRLSRCGDRSAHARRSAPELCHRPHRRKRQCGVRLHHRLGADPLPLSRPAPARRLRRSSLCAADRRRRHRAHRALRAERLDRQLARAARHQGRLYAARHHHRAHLHRASLRRAHGAAGARRIRPRTRGGVRHAWRQSPPNRVSGDAADAVCPRS